jgi:hypothetical protein
MAGSNGHYRASSIESQPGTPARSTSRRHLRHMGRTARQILRNILPFATFLALFRGLFRQFELIVVAADEDRADARRLNMILWKDAMEPNRCRG